MDLFDLFAGSSPAGFKRVTSGVTLIWREHVHVTL